MSPRAKTHNYLNLILGELEVQGTNPNSWAVLLDENGNLTEGRGCNIFLVKDGGLFTPQGQFVLEGITRGLVMDLALGVNLPVAERDLDLFEAYTADEVFLTSTSLCICPVSSVNGAAVGDGRLPGPITKRLTAAFSSPQSSPMRGEEAEQEVNMADNPSTSSGQDLSQVVESPQAERLATGFVFTEGPLWHPNGYLLFVDIRRSLIFRLTPGGEPEVMRENSGGANGLTFDLQGRLIMCEGDNRRVTRMEEDAKITPIAERWQGQRLHRPNDVVCRSDGSIYFTNPGGRLDPAEREIPFSGVHRITPNGPVAVVIRDMEYPNGLAFSPDEHILYVANSREFMHIRAYDIKPDGTAINGRTFADMSSNEPEGVPDGMKVDAAGRVYCTGPGGCWVFDPSGNHLGTIRLPEVPANCAWGGADHRTMFFTARTSIYSMRMKTPGTRVPGAPRKFTAQPQR